jgi:hypothetical protein
MSVKLDSEGLTVQSRKGYFAPKAPKEEKIDFPFSPARQAAVPIEVQYFRNHARAPFDP